MKVTSLTSHVLVALVVVAAAAFALPAPTGFSANVVGGNVVFDWDDVVGAVKYSLDIDATVTYTVYDPDTGEPLPDPATATVELSYGTSDRTDGGDMGDSDLTVPIATILADIAAQLGIAVADIQAVDASAAVKALSPGPGKGSQNNPHSAPDTFTLP